MVLPPTPALARSVAAAPGSRLPAAPDPASVSPAPAAPAISAASPADFARLEPVCRKAASLKRYGETIDSCTRAFNAKPDAGDIAVVLAGTEFERGRAAAAASWAHKAVAIDPDLAEAYVYIGSAEQQAGHTEAARTAYQKYLALQPAGRYAADLRAVLKDL
jgi:tetratricopeptide (TPR) repeat protein